MVGGIICFAFGLFTLLLARTAREHGQPAGLCWFYRIAAAVLIAIGALVMLVFATS